jgi:FkbM family methyltransferase
MKEIARKIKRILKMAISKELMGFFYFLFLKVDLVCQKEKFGFGYGAWDLVTKTIDSNSIIYSFGIGQEASFDTDLIGRFNLVIYGFDPTPKSLQWVKKQGFSNNFIMHGFGLAGYDGNVPFYPTKDPIKVSHTILRGLSPREKAITVPVKKLSSIMNELGHNRIDVLKMDIVGAEYDVIDDIEKSGMRPHQILIKFRHRFPGVGIKKSKEAIDKIRGMGYHLFSISRSNKKLGFIKKSS